MKNEYNLVDKAWIPMADHGRVSLRQVFAQPEYRSLGGNPVQKIALTKILLAVAQSAAPVEDEQAWKALGPAGLADHCLHYLDKWHDRFYLYGQQPFLQMPAVAAAKVQEFGAVLPEVSTGNTTVLSQIQVRRTLDNAEKALLIVCQMSFALAGKKTDNSVILSAGYQGKVNDKGRPSSSKPGPAVAFLGLLHNFLIGPTLLETLWLNLLTNRQITDMKMYPCGIGTPPWEQMPTGEDCAVAIGLKESLMGRLVPLCRFCLLIDDGLHYSEGLLHADYKGGVTDPSTAVDYSGKKPKALWVDPEKRPWRELTALLGFFVPDSSKAFQCWQLRCVVDRARDVVSSFAIWSGGLRVSSNAGEQFVSGSDDFVESLVSLHCDMLGEAWFVSAKY